jgi:hypothetical protein
MSEPNSTESPEQTELPPIFATKNVKDINIILLACGQFDIVASAMNQNLDAMIVRCFQNEDYRMIVKATASNGQVAAALFGIRTDAPGGAQLIDSLLGRMFDRAPRVDALEVAADSQHRRVTIKDIAQN